MARSPDSSTLLTVSDVLSSIAHRPWPLPERPWVMYQRWHDLLFAHWALPHDQVRPFVPQELELDVFEGKAWVGVIPFWMSHVRFRGMPYIPSATTFPELNVRTYVRAPQDPDKPGVYFFSLDAASLLAVIGARLGAGLPYFWADMRTKVSDAGVEYLSIRRQHPNAQFIAHYRARGIASTQKSDLERFVTERYCLYTVRARKVHRIQIHHLSWPLQPAEAEFDQNVMAEAHGLTLPAEMPVMQFAKFLEVYIFAPEILG